MSSHFFLNCHQMPERQCDATDSVEKAAEEPGAVEDPTELLRRRARSRREESRGFFTPDHPSAVQCLVELRSNGNERSDLLQLPDLHGQPGLLLCFELIELCEIE
jgi:hypothetical protein